MIRQCFLPFLLLFALILTMPSGIFSQHSIAKLACGPCEDYFGYSGSTRAPIAAIPDSIPGLFRFVQLAHPDTNVAWIQSSWRIMPDQYTVTQVQPGDTFVHQFTQNGLDTVFVTGMFQVLNGPQCYGYGMVVVNVTGLQLPPITTAETPVEATESTSLSAYPNPTRDFLHVNYDSKVAQQTIVTLYNAVGQLLSSTSFAANGSVDIDMRHLACGTYHLILIGPSGRQRILVLRE